MGLRLVSAPVAQPIDLAEARLHVRQDITDDDPHILQGIVTANEAAQVETQRSLVAARWKLTLDSPPSGPILLERGPVFNVISIKYIDMSGTQQTWAATEWVADLTTIPARITPRFGKDWPISLPQIGSFEVIFEAGSAAPITADATADTITIKGPWPTLAVGDAARFSNSGGALPAPLAADTDYYIQSVVSSGVYKVAATLGGAAIDLTTAGTCTSFIGEVPAGIKAWMLLRLGSLHENREGDTIARGSELSLPYIDRLLDPYRAF